MFAGVLMVVALGLSPLGRRLALGLPLPALVLFHGFRFPLELVMHQAAREGIMPSVMSYSGYNFDIVTGISALLLGGALLFRRVPLLFVAAWNLIGVLLLITIAAIAIAALPLFRVFGDDQLNVWITHFPYVWLPVMVAAAQLGHILISRRMIHEMRVKRTATANSPRSELQHRPGGVEPGGAAGRLDNRVEIPAIRIPIRKRF
jgi:hypothetical protein